MPLPSRLLSVVLLTVLAAGATRAATLLDRLPQPRHLIATGDTILVSDGSETPVKRIDPATAALVPLVHRMGTPAALVAGQDALFWLEPRGGTAPSGACTGTSIILTMRRTDLPSGRTSTLAVTDHCTADPVATPAIAADGALFWIASMVSSEEYRIERFSPADGATVTVYRADLPIAGLVVGHAYLYWKEEGRFPESGAIKRLPLAGGAVEVVHEPGAPMSGNLAFLADGRLLFATQGFPNSRTLAALDPATGATPLDLLAADD